MSDLDPSLMQDFLTESSELIEQLDADLVKLETAASGEQADLLNSAFRALHTIKGAAGFLGLDEVIHFAHAAEDALNQLRKGDYTVTAEVMDVLLQSADTVRAQIEAIGGGEPAPAGDEALIQRLKLVAAGKVEQAVADVPPAPDDAAEGDAVTDPAGEVENASDEPGEPLNLPPQKQDLVEFMAADLQEYAKQLEESVEGLKNDASRGDAATHLVEIADNLSKTAEFFELDALTKLIGLLSTVGQKAGDVPGDLADELAVRVGAIKLLIEEQAEALGRGRALAWPIELFEHRLSQLLTGEPLEEEIINKHEGDPAKLMFVDGLRAGRRQDDPFKRGDPPPQAPDDSPADAMKAETDEATAGKDAGKDKAVAPEQTIRVEVSRLESLLNLVGQLVLSKNRMLGLTRKLHDESVTQELDEAFGMAAGDLDRLTGELQVGVMRTRMQPLAKLFDRYPRVIRDMARMTEKKIELEIAGKDTEVDKSVLESLADPLVHILRNSADHGVEKPAQRLEAGKSETGHIRLEAEHQGSHVRIAIIDDGKGLDREVISNKAVERGLTTPEQLPAMTDTQVFNFIFEAGFSTADQVSDLSGRGVGMDVVRTNLNKVNGEINVSSEKGKGTTIEILIPLTVAIMPAMVVGVGAHLYAIPLQSVVEIVRPENCSTINGRPVMRLREQVLPLIDMTERLDESRGESDARFVVVVGVGGQRAGLVVSKLVGQQEIVIKPLDDEYTAGGPFSGATIQDNGEVSLILDVTKLIREPGAAAPRLAA